MKRSTLIVFILLVLALFAMFPEFFRTIHTSEGQVSGTVLGVWYPAGQSDFVNLPVGSVFRISINVTDALPFRAYYLILIYNTLYLDVISNPDTPTAAGTWACTETCEEGSHDVNEGLGKIEWEVFFTDDDGHSGGSGTLLFIDFLVTAVGATLLELPEYDPDNTVQFTLTGLDFNAMPYTKRDGEFNNSPFQLPRATFTFKSLNLTHQTENRIVQRDNVEFDASASFDPDGGSIMQYRWDFGDGSNDCCITTTNPVETHSFRTRTQIGGETFLSGSFAVRLTVIDDDDQERSITRTVVVEAIPAHDISISQVVAPVTAQLGSVVKITVVVSNLGTFNETFLVKVSFDSTTIQEPVNVTLEQSGLNDTRRLELDWNTAGLDDTIYQIKARADPVQDETKIDNNQQIVHVRLIVVTQSSFPIYLGGGILGIIVIGVAYSLLKRRTPRPIQ